MTSARRQLPRKPLSSHSPQHQSLHHVRHALCLDYSSTICGHKMYQPCMSIGWSFGGQATRKLPITITLVYQVKKELPVFLQNLIIWPLKNDLPSLERDGNCPPRFLFWLSPFFLSLRAPTFGTMYGDFLFSFFYIMSSPSLGHVLRASIILAFYCSYT